MAIELIAKTLGTGSGIDISSLVSQLVEAQFANKNQSLTSQSDKLTAQISKISELKSGITTFSNALAQRTAGTTLSTQPTSSRTDLVTVTRLAGADVSSLQATIEVRQLAQQQVASTSPFSGGSSSAVGTGTLTLTFGNATVSDGTMTGFTAGQAAPIAIEIDSAHATLSGVAQAINAANKGVTASIITDSDGARLVLKSQTGASQAFELRGSAGLEGLDIGTGTTGSTINTTAQDAIVALDGVPTRYPINTISTLVPGVRLDLVGASAGTKVSIGASRPTDALSQALTDFVDSFNEIYAMVKAAVDPIDGELRGDAGAKDLLRQMRALTLVPLVKDPATGRPSTLADIGVATQRDGTLKIDSSRVTKVLQTYPADFEAMFASGAGITAALAKIVTSATGTITVNGVNEPAGLGASQANYTKAQTKLERQQEDIAVKTEQVRTRMTQQFAAMDSKVAAYKSTQSFLEQQIAAWNSQD
ncbi:flagellar filament capping protein FliD [Sphingomonas sp. MMS12-HWE2-04]|uniref:flagellar filament capping protein FliD n=1 Tax=Sphingomonas sp. MMS12-HWE2-04 TaxID=3234199 RepID=UPI00384DB8F5